MANYPDEDPESRMSEGQGTAPGSEHTEYDTRNLEEQSGELNEIKEMIKKGEEFSTEVAEQLKELLEENDTIGEHLGRAMELEEESIELIKKAGAHADKGNIQESEDLVHEARQNHGNAEEAIQVVREELERLFKELTRISKQEERIDSLETEIEAMEKRLEKMS